MKLALTILAAAALAAGVGVYAAHSTTRSAPYTVEFNGVTHDVGYYATPTTSATVGAVMLTPGTWRLTYRIAVKASDVYATLTSNPNTDTNPDTTYLARGYGRITTTASGETLVTVGDNTLYYLVVRHASGQILGATVPTLIRAQQLP